MSLQTYHAKRNFQKTAEPKGREDEISSGEGLRFVIQKHAARRLHYDLRLQFGGVMRSWAVTKGPSLDTSERRLAVHVEDHPIAYNRFEGTIPHGEYGGGTVMIWDQGVWEPRGDAEQDFAEGHLKFNLYGEKLSGGFMLLRMKPRSPRDKDNWLLIKEKDDSAHPLSEGDILVTAPNSVISGRDLDEIGAAAEAVWHSKPQEAPPTIDAAAILKAKKSKLPTDLAPALATLVKAPPQGANWLHEIKFDGYRALTIIDCGNVKVMTRNGNDWTSRVPSLLPALKALTVDQAVFDGEIVVLTPDGISNFGALQDAFAEEHSEKMIYYLFDLLYLNGYDLRGTPLTQRKHTLEAVLHGQKADGKLRYSEHLEAHGEDFYQHSCRFGLEGIISKRKDSPYRSGRGDDWQKSKCIEREEFVIGGYAKPSAGNGIGALLMGYYNKRKDLIYIGKVGTGFNERTSRMLRQQLDGITRATTPFAKLPGPAARGAVHVEPVLVAEIEFGAWTESGHLRHAAFKGLREDKPAQDVTREDSAGLSLPGTDADDNDNPSHREAFSDKGEPIIEGIKITHPDRVLHVAQGVTKLGLAEYFSAIAPWIVPHIAGRPLSLFRCPGSQSGGKSAGCFFQKHAKDGLGDAVRRIPVPEHVGTKDESTSLYLAIDNAAGLIALVQYGVIEIHPWGAKETALDCADQMIFDFDPDPAVEWPQVIEAAKDIRSRLKAQGLASLVKTTGGKGLHVVVPLNPAAPWEKVKNYARRLAETMVADNPDKYVATMTKAKRSGKIFIDFFRNDRGSTAIAPYSTRAREGAPIATPLDWDELSPALLPSHFTIETIYRRMKAIKNDPWADFATIKQKLPNISDNLQATPRAKRRSRGA